MSTALEVAETQPPGTWRDLVMHDAAGHAQLLLRRHGLPTLTVDLQFAEPNGFTGTIADGCGTTPTASR